MDRGIADQANAVGGAVGDGYREASEFAARGPSQARFLKLYRLLSIVAWPLLLLYYLLMVLIGRKYRGNFLYRMGLKPPRRLPPGERIWFHALSVGETLSVVPLVRAVRRLCPSLEIIFSTATEAGQEIARKRLTGDINHLLYLPHDFPFIADLYVQRLHPALFVLVETDIWPNLLHSLKSRNIGTALVNARLSPRSADRFRNLSRFFSPCDCFDLIFPQSSQDRQRFLELGATCGQMQGPGNLKFDSLSPLVSGEEQNDLRTAAGIAAGRLVWIAGSTHPGEESMLLQVHRKLQTVYPDLLLIIAPRQVARKDEIAALAKNLGLTTAARSAGVSEGNRDVYLLDTLGELGKFYALADVAFIGGSLVPFGGHNPLEAIAQSKPCIWGPHLFNFRDLEAGLLTAGCGAQVSTEAQLLSVLQDWLGDAAFREQARQNAKRFLASSTGCAQRIAQVLCETMDCSRRRGH